MGATCTMPYSFGRTSPDMAQQLSKQGTDDRPRITGSMLSRPSGFGLRELASCVSAFPPNGMDALRVEPFPGVSGDWAYSSEAPGTWKSTSPEAPLQKSLRLLTPWPFI